MVTARILAKSAGNKFYTTGKPCKHGHIAHRRTSDGYCVVCLKGNARSNQKKYRQSNYEKCVEYDKTYYRQHKDQLLARHRNDYLNNKERYLDYSTKWRLANPSYYRILSVKRRLIKQQATPKWEVEERKQIRQLYLQSCDISQTTGVPHEVDHIVPLRSKIVCGLHCLFNLRVVTKTVNRTKSNKLEGIDS